MVSAPPALVAISALSVSIGAIEFVSSAAVRQLGATTAPAQTAWVLMPLAEMVVLLAAVASIYRQLSRHDHVAVAAAAGARAGREVAAAAVVCASVGLLLNEDDVARPPRAIGAAAAHVLPFTSTAAFFLAMALVFVHVVGAGAGNGPIQAAPVRILTKVTLGAAAGVVCLMALAALYTEY